MRKLATIQFISWLSPIEWADRLEIAKVLWRECVVEKWKFCVWEMIVYCEVDSFLPELPEYEFLRARCFKIYDGKGWFRIKTIKLKWQVSQWLILPRTKDVMKYSIGDDVAEQLWIIKYDLELLKERSVQQHTRRKYKLIKWLLYSILIRAKVKLWIIKYDKPFPSFIPKTDEERVQNCVELLEKYKWKDFVVHEKLDWSSITCYLRKWKFWVCSRNLELVNTDNQYREAVTRLWVEQMMRDTFWDRNIAIQWELVWPNIQNNRYKFNDTKIYWFTCFDIDKQKRVSTAILWIDNTVPYIDTVEVHENISERVWISEWKSYINNSVTREWIVVRSLDESISFKVINPNFLLENDL